MLEKIKTQAQEVWAVRPNKREIAIIELSQLSAIFGSLAANKEGNDWIAGLILLFSLSCFWKAHMTWFKRELPKAMERYEKKHKT